MVDSFLGSLLGACVGSWLWGWYHTRVSSEDSPRACDWAGSREEKGLRPKAKGERRPEGMGD